MVLQHTAQRSGKLLSFLRRELRMSSSLVSRLKFQNAFAVDGIPVHTDYPVSPGAVITVCLDEPEPEYPAEDGPLDILYEDEALIALDKSAGLLVHPSFSRNTGTLANYLLGYYRRTGQRCAVHPVSRLDRDTFGVILLAKNAHVHALLRQAMADGGLHKQYCASLYGALPQPEGVIDAPIARLSPQSLLRCVRDDGQAARSRYRVLQVRGPCSLVALEPLTGRTHQLRVHCAHLGAPVLGDPQYGTEASRAYSLTLGLTTQQLCAAQLSLVHPLTGQPLTLRSRQRVIFP